MSAAADLLRLVDERIALALGGARAVEVARGTVVAVYESTRTVLVVLDAGDTSVPAVYPAITVPEVDDEVVVLRRRDGWIQVLAVLDRDPAIPTLGYGLSDNSAPAVGLTTAEAFATAETSISAATYADVSGVSISLAAGTWLIIAECHGRIVDARAQMNVAITDSSNNIVREGTQDIPASGSASVNATGSIGLSVIVSPGSTTTYKMRAARGNTTNTGTWTAMDGASTGTANNASDNTDKATSIRAIRVA